MEKKYIVLVTEDPYGRDDGFKTHPAKSSVLNNKIYNTREEAEIAAREVYHEYSHEEIKKQFTLDYEIFCELRDFILYNRVLNINGKIIENKCSTDRLIAVFMNMYELNYQGYTEIQYKQDEELYQQLIGDEPKAAVVEIDV